VHKIGNKIECNNMHGERIKIINFCISREELCLLLKPV